MTPNENLHYAIGELAYAMACSDGILQKEEREKFQKIVAAEIRLHDADFDVSDVIFKILEKDKADPQMAYDSAMRQIKLNSHYLSPQLKQTFIKVIEKVAMAFPPSTLEEIEFVNKFKEDIEPIKGDPIYYEKKK